MAYYSNVLQQKVFLIEDFKIISFFYSKRWNWVASFFLANLYIFLQVFNDMYISNLHSFWFGPKGSFKIYDSIYSLNIQVLAKFTAISESILKKQLKLYISIMHF